MTAESAKFRYVEYGKQFVSNGATDFLVLDHSDAEMAALVDHFRRHVLNFPSKTPFVEKVGNISVALLAYEGGYLFTQIQYRREGEKSPKPLTNRPFNQLRFTRLTSEDIKGYFSSSIGLFTSLLYDASQEKDSKEKPFTLKSYIQPGRQQKIKLSRRLEEFDPEALSGNKAALVEFLVDALVNAADRQDGKPATVAIDLAEYGLISKLEIVQAIQYWVFPALGVITFALDYITEQNVSLRLFPPAADMLVKPQRTYMKDKVDSTSFGDIYFDTVKNETREDLYHDKFAAYLRKLPTTQLALRVFKLATKCDWTVPGEARTVELQKSHQYLLQEDLKYVFGCLKISERLEILRNDQSDSTLLWDLILDWFETGVDEQYRQTVLDLIVGLCSKLSSHPQQQSFWYKLFEHFSRGEKINLLFRSNISSDLTVMLLTYQFKQVDGRLNEYYQYHLACLPERRRESRVVDLLRQSVQCSPASVLENIVENRSALDREMIWLYEDDKRKEKGHLSRIYFQAEPPGSNHRGPYLFAALLQYPSSGLIHHINSSLAQQGSHFFDEVLNELDRQDQLEKFKWLLEHLDKPEPVPFNKILLHLGNTQNYPKLAQYPDTFKDILSFGRESVYGDQPLLTQPLSERLKTIVRDACLFVSTKSLDFAEWWFYAELAYDREYIKDGYPKLANSLFPVVDQITSPKFQYLIQDQSAQKGMSLRRACSHPNSDDVNEILFQEVLQIRISNKIPINPADITYLVRSLLQDPKANQLLVEVVKSGPQKESLIALHPTVALQWLRNTRGVLRETYRVGGVDKLYRCMCDLKEPDEDFILEMLVNEDAVLFGNEPHAENMSWQEYLKTCHHWQARLPELGISTESKLGCFLTLAQRLVDPIKFHLSDRIKFDEAYVQRQFQQRLPHRRRILDILASRCVDSQLFPVLDEEDVIHLYLFYFFDNSAYIKRNVSETLNAFLSLPNLSKIISSFQPNAIVVLQNYVRENALSGQFIRVLDDIRAETENVSSAITKPGNPR
jgi:hypothetical protein